MSELTDFRKAKDEFFSKDHHSPLTPQQRRRFTGLVYYDEDLDLRFALTIQELPDQQKETIEMATSTGEFQTNVRWGTITFSVNGEPATLTVYQGVESDEFFLPFADTTNGETSYGAGRYLDLVPMDHGRVLVDFNYAYNPYCAYNPDWSCPIPPAENRLSVPVQAGEKIYPDAAEH